MADGREPIEDDEIIYRRIPTPAYYDPSVSPFPSPMAFHPRCNDLTGLSVYRAKYKTPEQVAATGRDRPFYIAELRAGDLRRHGIEVVPVPLPDDPGHAELPGLTYAKRRFVQEHEVLLARKLCRILGPFGPKEH
jgi:hypothetical protein